jgi:protein SCO1/2
MRLGRAGLRSAAIALPWLILVTGCGAKFNGQLVDPPQPVALAGVNWDGKPFQLSDHQGKVAIVFFGYTYCPDVCPFTLAKMKQLYDKLGDRAKDVEVVFVSVDPKRDTVEKLAKYVPSFDRRFYGVRLELDEVTNLATTTFSVAVKYGAPKYGLESQSFYLVDHTGTYFVVDRQGQLRLKYPPNVTADEMLPDLEKLLGA